METLWEKIRKSVVNGVTVAAEKTEEFTKLGKAKIDILNTKRKISAKFTELGSILYDAIKKGNTDEAVKSAEVVGLVNAIKELESVLDGKEQKYEEMKKPPETEEKTDTKKSDVNNE